MKTLALLCLLPHTETGWAALQDEYDLRERTCCLPHTPLTEAIRLALIAANPAPDYLRRKTLRACRREILRHLLP